MKKSKPIFSAFVLALILVFTSIASSTVYADNGDHQGVADSKKSPPPPPPPPSSQSGDEFDEEIMYLVWLWINGVYV